MSLSSTKYSPLEHKNTSILDKTFSIPYRTLIFIGTLIFFSYILLSSPYLDQTSQYLARFMQLGQRSRPFYDGSQSIENDNDDDDDDPTDISHIMIGIASSINSWKKRKPYIESWWKPNITEGYLFLDQEPKGEFLPWPTSSPPYRVSENVSRYKPYDKHAMPHAIRMVRVIEETFRLAHEGIRWFVMADDDTILFLDNLVDVLSRYDHGKYYYIGENSETVSSNVDNSFEMAFGGAGYAISYPLAEILAKRLDVCIKRYPFLYGSDFILQSCMADIGVSLTHEKGFHQIDLHKDLSGFLSSHPHAPFLSLHHLDTTDPIFPLMNRVEALNHLMEAARIDQSRLLQQTICYEKSKNWSFSISWGYSTQVYQTIIPPSVLEKPLQTFSAWKRLPRHAQWLSFMFNTRWLSNNPCEMPHVFFLEYVERDSEKNQTISTYTRRSAPMTLEACSSLSPSSIKNESFPATLGDIAKIIVFSPSTKYSAMGGTRRECCDVLDQAETNVAQIKYRTCTKNEILGAD